MSQLPDTPDQPKPPAQPAGPVEPRDVRASDDDRNKVAELLRDAAGEGRLTLEELDERLDGVYKAKTYAELEPYVRDLPVATTGATPAAPVVSVAPATAPGLGANRIGGKASSSVSIAVMSGSVRKGPWVVPPDYTAVAFWGGVELDLRDARFAQREVTIRAFAVMGGIEIVVPDDVEVDVTGVGIMGGFDHTVSGTENAPPAPPGAPVVRVTGFAFWGGVEVKRKPRRDQVQAKPKPHTELDH